MHGHSQAKVSYVARILHCLCKYSCIKSRSSQEVLNYNRFFVCVELLHAFYNSIQVTLIDTSLLLLVAILNEQLKTLVNCLYNVVNCF